MKLTRILRLLSLAATLFTLTAQATDIIWTSTSDGNWEDANNWTPNQVPGVGDRAFLNTGSFTVTINSSVIIDGLLTGTGTGQQTITVPGTSTLTVSNSAQIGANASIQLNGGTFACTNATVSGNMTVNGGYLTGGLTVSQGATLTLFNTASLQALALTNFGTINWTGNPVYAGQGTHIYNYSLWTVQGTDVFEGTYYDGAPAIIDNYGTFSKTDATTTTLDAATTFNNYGIVNIQNGALSMAGPNTAGDGATFGGAGFTLINGSTANWNGTIYATNVVLQGSGTLQAYCVMAGNLSVSNGTLAGNIAICSNSSLTLSTTFFSALYLTNQGTVNWTHDPIDAGDSHIYNQGLWDAKADGQFSGTYLGGQGSYFNNATNGIFRKSGGFASTTLDNETTMNNSGLIDVQKGQINLNGPATLLGSGSYNFGLNNPQNYGQLYLSGAVVLAGTVSANLNGQYFPSVQTAFDVIHYTSETGAFTNTVLPGGITWETNYYGTTFEFFVSAVGNGDGGTPLVITNQPVSLTNNVGTNPQFTVGVSGSDPHFQWYEISLAGPGAIPGATDATLVFNDALRANEGSYFAIVTNSINAVTSAIVTLNVNDPAIITQPVDVGFVYTNGGTATFHVEAAGTGDLTYQWYTTNNNRTGLNILTNKPGIINGTTNATLTITQNRTRIATTTNYVVIVTGFNGSVRSRVASLVSYIPPVVKVLASPKSLIEGNNVKLVAATKGTAPLHYQWQLNGQTIDGATNSTYLALDLQPPPETQTFPYVDTFTCLVSNNFGASASNSAPVNIMPDVKAPKVTFARPTSNAQMTNTITLTTNLANGDILTAPNFVLSGNAADNGLIANIYILRTYPYSQNPPTSANLYYKTPGAVTFSNELVLAEGTNTYQIWAVDSAGNQSVHVSRTFFCVKPFFVTINTNGYGSTLPVGSVATFNNYGTPTNGASLQIGRSYTIKAVADGNNIFTNWTDANNFLLGTNANLTFKMDPNLIIYANFVTNPIVANHADGLYTGLFYETNNDASPNVRFLSAGAILKFAVKTNGSFSAAMTVNGKNYTVANKFNLSGDQTVTVKRKTGDQSDLTVSLHLDWATGTRQVSGTVSCAAEGWTGPLVLNQVIYSKENPYQNPARYTLFVPPAIDAEGGTNSPGGYGVAAITNNAAGEVKLAGYLADGTTISAGVYVSKDSNAPVFVSLYKGEGLLEGWLNFGETNVSGLLTWIKTSAAPNKPLIYLNGFTNVAAASGNVYSYDKSQGQVFGSTTNFVIALADVEGASLDAGGNPLQWHVYLKNNSFLPILNSGNPTNKITGSIAPASGLIKLQFTATDGSKKNIIGAVDLPSLGGSGYFISTNTGGSFILHSVQEGGNNQ